MSGRWRWPSWAPAAVAFLAAAIFLGRVLVHTWESVWAPRRATAKLAFYRAEEVRLMVQPLLDGAHRERAAVAFSRLEHAAKRRRVSPEEIAGLRKEAEAAAEDGALSPAETESILAHAERIAAD